MSLNCNLPFFLCWSCEQRRKMDRRHGNVLLLHRTRLLEVSNKGIKLSVWDAYHMWQLLSVTSYQKCTNSTFRKHWVCWDGCEGMTSTQWLWKFVIKMCLENTKCILDLGAGWQVILNVGMTLEQIFSCCNQKATIFFMVSSYKLALEGVECIVQTQRKIPLCVAFYGIMSALLMSWVNEYPSCLTLVLVICSRGL